MSSFEQLGLDPRLLRVLADLGYEEPTPIQREAIPALLEGRDVLGQAATGTGKTAAFALPLIQRLCAGEPKPRVDRTTHALVLLPTRELAMQVADAFHRYGKALGIKAVPIYGGQPIERQIRALHGGVDVVLATPGRALDHLRRRSLSFEAVEVVVIDEADEMLDMGFAEDLEAILGETPKTRQTSLFSATMAPRILQITNRHLRDPIHLRIAKEQPKSGEIPKVRQVAYAVARQHKIATLVRVLDVEQPALTIVFCRTRLDVETLYDALAARGFTVDLLHGGMTQEQRDRSMRRFRTEAVEVLVATDVAARGLDVKGISHVVNFDIPPDPEDYIHRIGRTGRAGREGVAITLFEPRQHRLLRNIERETKQRIDVPAVPTVADLRARRLELTTSSIREALAEGNLEKYRVVVETLSSEHDIVELALAAIKLAHVAQGGDGDDKEIPRIEVEQPRPMAPPARQQRDKHQNTPPRFPPKHPPRYATQPRAGQGQRDERDPRDVIAAPGREPHFGKDGQRIARPPNQNQNQNQGQNPNDPRARKPFGQPPASKQLGPTAQMFVGAGSKAGVRAKDLVGAIANEAGVEGRAIGAIQITDAFSLVELPADRIDDIIGKLGNMTIFNKRVEVRKK